MSGVLLALAASGAWGVSDYLGGVRTRSLALPVVLPLSQLFGLAVVLCVVGSRGTVVAPSAVPGAALVSAALAGACGVVALGCLYLLMARGGVWLVAPVSALAAALPVLTGVASGERLSGRAAAGIVLAVAGALCAGWRDGGGGRGPVSGTTIALGLTSAAGSAGFFVLIREAGRTADPAAVTLVGRLSGAALVVAWALGGLRSWGPSRAWGSLLATGSVPLRRRGPALAALAAICGVGAGDAVAELCFATASTRAPLSVVAPVASLYPAVAVLLALVLIRERLGRTGYLGLGAALAGVVLLAA